jgi:hypothetical protein
VELRQPAEALRFIGTHPVTLYTSHAMIARWFAAVDGDGATVVRGLATGEPLSRVRDLRRSGVGSSDPSAVARVAAGGAAPARPCDRRRPVLVHAGWPRPA